MVLLSTLLSLQSVSSVCRDQNYRKRCINPWSLLTPTNLGGQPRNARPGLSPSERLHMKKQSKLERSINRVIGTIITTIIKTQLWMGLSLLVAHIFYWKYQDIGQAMAVYFLMQFLTFGLIYNYWYNFLGPLYTGKRKYNDYIHSLCMIFMPIVFFVTYPKARKRLLRCYNIGQKWMASAKASELREREKEHERFRTHLVKEREQFRARLVKVKEWYMERRSRQDSQQFIKSVKAIGQHLIQLDPYYHWDRDSTEIREIFDRYQHAVPSHKENIEHHYRQSLAPIDDGKKLPEVNLKQPTLEGKLLYLAAVIRAEKDNYYNRLDFSRSDFNAGRYVYTSNRSAIDIKYWSKNLPSINAYLGGEWVVEPLDGTSLVLYQLAELPPLIPFQTEFLQKDRIFYGFNVRTGERYYTSLEVMPHTLVVGKSGSGKSVFLNQIMASLIYNIDHFEKIYLIDLKGGVELSKYNGLHTKLHLVDHYDDLLSNFQQIITQMEDRLKHMKQNGLTLFDGPHLCIICDEFAQIAQYPAITKEEKDNKLQLQSYLNRISMLGRAPKVNLFLQLQKATVQNIDSGLRNNIATKICFKVHSNSDAATVFGNTEDLPAIASLGGFKNLQKGRYILSDDISGEDSYMQSSYVAPDFPLARLLQTADDARAVSEAQVDEQESEAERTHVSKGERLSKENL